MSHPVLESGNRRGGTPLWGSGNRRGELREAGWGLYERFTQSLNFFEITRGAGFAH